MLTVFICLSMGAVFPFVLLSAEIGKAERQKFNRCATAGVTTEDQIAAYRKFIEAHPQSDFADDAYLEIAERQRKLNAYKKARETLKYVKEKFPNAHKLRYIYISDIKEEWIPEWKSFSNQNPIFTSDYIDFKLAELDYQEGNNVEAREELKKLLARTTTPTILRTSSNPAIRTAFDLRVKALQLSSKVADRLGDHAWKEDILTSLAKENSILKEDIPLHSDGIKENDKREGQKSIPQQIEIRKEKDDKSAPKQNPSLEEENIQKSKLDFRDISGVTIAIIALILVFLFAGIILAVRYVRGQKVLRTMETDKK